jgi:hypothetical protein
MHIIDGRAPSAPPARVHINQLDSFRPARFRSTGRMASTSAPPARARAARRRRSDRSVCQASGAPPSRPSACPAWRNPYSALLAVAWPQQAGCLQLVDAIGQLIGPGRVPTGGAASRVRERASAAASQFHAGINYRSERAAQLDAGRIRPPFHAGGPTRAFSSPVWLIVCWPVSPSSLHLARVRARAAAGSTYCARAHRHPIINCTL